MVTNLLRDAQVSRVVSADAVGVHHIGIVGAHHQFGQVVIQRWVVVLGPEELLCKGNALVGIVPRRVVFRIERHILVLPASVVGLSRIVVLVSQCDAPCPAVQFAQRAVVVV